MSGDLLKRLTILTLLLMAGLYFLRWQKESRIGEHSDQIATLLDDRRNPTEVNFAGRSARLCKILGILRQAEEDGFIFKEVVQRSAEQAGLGKEATEILNESLYRNYRIAIDSGLLEGGDQLDLMLAGELPSVTEGPYAGDEIDFEYFIPIDDAPELEVEFSNFKLQPATVTERYGNPVDKEAYEKASSFYRARLISQSSYVRVGASYEQSQRGP